VAYRHKQSQLTFRGTTRPQKRVRETIATKSRTHGSALQERKRYGVCTNKTQPEKFRNRNQSPITYYILPHRVPLMAGSNSQQCYVRAGRPSAASRSATSCLRTGSSPSRMAITKYIHNTRTTPNPLHPLMTANTQTTAVYYVERKCWRVPGYVPAGTTFELALTARHNIFIRMPLLF
jgi:hypothetical protein